MKAPKIESIPVTLTGTRNSQLPGFCETLAKLKIGESFMVPAPFSSNWRYAITCAQHLLKRRFASRRDGNSFRIGRIE